MILFLDNFFVSLFSEAWNFSGDIEWDFEFYSFAIYHNKFVQHDQYMIFPSTLDVFVLPDTNDCTNF